MTTIEKNTDLNDGVTNTVEGWETSAASAFNVVVYTVNTGAAYSDDHGDTFTAMDLSGLCNAWGEVPMGDQVVVYIPRINQFAWLALTATQNVVLALASPQEIEESRGRNWTSWLIPANRFEDGVSKFDQPTVSVGDNFLYVTCNLGLIAIAIRLSIVELSARGSLNLIYFVAPGVFWLKPAQNTGGTGYFAALLSGTYSVVRVFSWPERGDISLFNITIATIPTEDFVVKTPDRDDWLANQRGSLQVLGLTLTGKELWAAWFGNRRVSGQTANSFNYPHIGIAIINVQGRKLVRQRYIWNPEHAFVWPSLATNADGDVGMSFCWGGGQKWYPQYGVGMLTGRDQSFKSMTSGTTIAAGGDYTSIRMSFPNAGTFCASGFNQMKPGRGADPVNHPHYVLFRP